MELISKLDAFDKAMLLTLNGCHNAFFDVFMYQISKTVIWVPLYLFIIWQISKIRRWDTVFTVIFLIIMVALSDQLSGVIKHAVLRLRPSHDPSILGLIHTVNDYRGGYYGFVSSHAANTFAFAIFLSLFFRNKWVTLSIFTWATVVSYSRIYLGVHYPFDILGGIIVGLFSGWLLFILEKKFFEKGWNKKFKKQKEIK